MKNIPIVQLYYDDTYISKLLYMRILNKVSKHAILYTDDLLIFKVNVERKHQTYNKYNCHDQILQLHSTGPLSRSSSIGSSRRGF